MNKNSKPVVIVGAGLSGLACAKTLKDNHIPFLLLEKTEEVGGKLKTMITDEGYRLDHGFQVLLTSYPELKYFIDLKKLDLKYFNSGSLIFDGQKTRLLANPILHPARLLSEIFSDLASFKDKLLVTKLIVQLQFLSKNEKIKNKSTLLFLQDFGFSDEFIRLFWTPFLTGVFLDPDLEIKADFFIFLIRGFSSGRVSVPAQGMQEIPKQMAQKISAENIRLNTSVKEFNSDYVLLENGEKIEASFVVKTSQIKQNENLYYCVQNFYFTTSEQLNWGSWLVLVPKEFNFSISTIAIMNQVSAAYGIKSSECLLSLSVVGSKDVSVDQLMNELRQISKLPLLDLKFKQKFEIQKALPKMKEPNENGFLIQDGIYYCGDWAVSPSINGALNSGRLVAEKIISRSKDLLKVGE